MWSDKVILLLGIITHSQLVSSWPCTQNSDCIYTNGAVCVNNECGCPTGQQQVLGGTLCANSAPYLTSRCYEDFQCSRLATNFQCRRNSDGEEGQCFCREGFHYQNGRCWRSVDYDSACLRHEDCMGRTRDIFSMSCDAETRQCVCSDGYYRRQRGECRKIAHAVGDACVLDEDCQFQNGVCNIRTFQCYDSTGSAKNKITTRKIIAAGNITSQITKQDGSSTRHGGVCGANSECASPFICSNSICVCPLGYYGADDSSICYAELGSPSTPEQCVALFAEVRDGVCTCQANFFFEEDMRNCVKVARTLSDSCMADNMCHTFGAAVRCSEPGNLPWNLRECECITEQAVWDQQRLMCRLFVGVGESCQVSSDCLAGELEIECVLNEDGEGTCTCPPGTVQSEGLCITSGLELGDACQVSQECTGTENTVCEGGRCSCGYGYQELDGFCAPTLGGTCAEDSACVIEHSICAENGASDTRTCQCGSGYLEDDNECWPVLDNSTSSCDRTAQCAEVLGVYSACVNQTCVCTVGNHLRDGRCWPETSLFQDCSRTSECFLGAISERVVCRNSICQCHFDFPYSEELNTCLSSASTKMASLLTVLTALFYVLSH